MKFPLALATCLGLTLSAMPAFAQVAAGAAEKFDSAAIDLENLDKIDVRSASVREQRLFRTPAAVYMVTGDEIRRSGARSLPEALRMVPGLDVAQLGDAAWSVSARAFSGRANNQLLVIIDGRTIYSPTFAGIRWEAEPFPLEDIDRIEVVRGPSAVAYGANAINGVINIFTKTAHVTDGWLISASSGSPGQGLGTVRYARKTRTNKNLRLWANYDDRPGGSGRDTAFGHSQMASVGLRADLMLTPRTDLEIDALIGDGMFADGQRLNAAFTAPAARARAQRAFVLGRWEFDPTGNSAVSEMVVQFFVDANRHQALSLNDDHDVYEGEFRYRLPAGRRQEITWGGGHRTMVARGAHTGFLSAKRIELSNVAVQDVMAIVPTKLTLTAGARLAHHSEGGWLFDPDMRWAWSRTARQTLWTSVSRASRPPSLADESQERYAPSPWYAEEYLDTGRVTAFESGYRIEPVQNVTMDTAVFVNLYRSTHAASAVTGRTYGFETLARWTPTAMWSIDGWYSAFRAGLAQYVPIASDGMSRVNSPSHQWQVRSRLNLHQTEFDTTFGISADIPYAGVDGYRRLDVRVGRKVARGIELSLAGQNLLGSSHFHLPVPQVAESRYFPRHAGLKATWQF